MGWDGINYRYWCQSYDMQDIPVAVKLRLASVSWQTAPRTSSPQERNLGSPSQEVSLRTSHVAGEVGLTHHQVGEAVEREVFNNNIMFLMKPE